MFGDIIKKLRKEQNLTQVDFAAIFKISNGTIAMWETNKRQPDYDMLTRLADYFNVSVDYLLGREEKSTYTVPENLQGVPVAFSGGLEDLTQEDLDEVSKFVEFLKSKKKDQ